MEHSQSGFIRPSINIFSDKAGMALLQLDVLEKMNDTGTVPADFWFLSTLILTSILVIFLGIITRYFNQFLKDDKEFKNLTSDAIRWLKENVQVMRKEQEYLRRDTDDNSKDIDDLKKRRR